MYGILAIFPLITTAIYLINCLLRMDRTPVSISETSYECDPKLCSIYCIGLGILLFPPWVLNTPEDYQFVCFLGCVGVIAAGTSPYFRDSFEAKIHYIGGGLAMLAWIVWMCLGHLYIELGITVGITLALTLIRRQSWVFWAEIVSILMLIVILLKNK